MSSGLSSRFPFRLGSRFIEGLLGLVYPRNCDDCEAPLDESAGRELLCEPCRKRLHPIYPPFCQVCGQTYEAEVSAAAAKFRCANCADLDLAFDFAVGACRNEGLARELIHRFKYGKQHHLCRLLGGLLGQVFEEERLEASLESGERWTLVPVPLHRKRLRERGFNQAEELCRVLRRARPGAFDLSNALRRTRYTGRQAVLDREDRLTNLKDAFALAGSRRIRAGIAGRSVLLVDDVLTTGATASECARVLVEDGDAAKVVVITVVRG